jgi:hypothetical protein
MKIEKKKMENNEKKKTISISKQIEIDHLKINNIK